MRPRQQTLPRLAAPSFYRHTGFPEWGVGIALFRDAEQEELTLLFEAVGLRTLPLPARALASVPAGTLDEALRGRLVGMAKGRQTPAQAESPIVLRRRRVVSPEPARPAEAPPKTEPDRESKSDGSGDVMDRKRRLPGSYEAGKRR